MELSLGSYLEKANNTHDFLENHCALLSIDQLEKKVVELQSDIKTIQAVAYQLANISNIANRLLLRKKRAKNARDSVLKKNTGRIVTSVTAAYPDKKAISYIDPSPTFNDSSLLHFLNPVQSVEIINGVKIPVCTVEKMEDIPISKIYFINELKQFAINIEGIIIRGDLCNISDYQENQSATCEYGIHCKSFDSKTTCSYYHDPFDYKHHNMEIPSQIRSMTIGSWIYSKKKTPKTYFTRHLGSRDRLIYDINTLKKVQYKEEISNRQGQLIHDLLIYMILNARGLLPQYPHWKHMPKVE